MAEYQNCNAEDEKFKNYTMEDYTQDIEKFRKIYNEEIAKERLASSGWEQTSPYLEMIRILSIRSDATNNTVEQLNKQLREFISIQIMLVEENILKSVYAQIKSMEESLKNCIDKKFCNIDTKER